MQSYVHIERVSEDIYTLRFYSEKIDSEEVLDNLPEYIGVGLLKVKGEVGLISATIFRDGQPLSLMHILDGSLLVEELGCKSLIFDRHKNGRVVRKMYVLPLPKRAARLKQF